MFHLCLNVVRWVAWVPGIEQSADWGTWTLGQALNAMDAPPDLSFVPPVVRRRLSHNSRLAIRAAHDCLAAEVEVASAVFCSRHGECKRTLAIFEAMARGEAVSPTQFSQSVHNAAAGIFSIERKLRIPTTSIAAGTMTAEQGFIEAAAQVEAGMGPVLWVMSDDRQSAPFDQFVQTPELPFAIAMVLGHFPGLPSLTLLRDSVVHSTGKPAGTSDLLAVLTGQDCFRIKDGNGWRWRYQAD